MLCIVAMLPLTIQTPNTITYSSAIASILNQNCVGCHRTNGSAPFTLNSYSQAKKFANMIRLTTESKLMPPWKASEGDFRGKRQLTRSQIVAIKQWVLAGCPPGDLTRTPKPPTFTEGWTQGKPDLIIEMAQPFTVPADGPDLLQNFVLPTQLSKDQTVASIEILPSNPKVVHHALVFLDNSGQAKKLDQATPEPGFTSFGGPGFFPSGSLGGWAPGATPHRLPDSVGRYFSKGSDIVLQLHYHPSGKPETDRSKIGIYFSKVPPTKLVGGIALENWDIQIQPGQSNYKRTARYTLPVDAEFLTVTPHMHLLGKKLNAWATLPNGKQVTLVGVDEWDFRWQDTFVFREPIRLPKGTELEMITFHDNSQQNPTNPSMPPKVVSYGEGSLDEMSLCIFEVTTDKVSDLLNLIADDTKHRKVVERAIQLAQRASK